MLVAMLALLLLLMPAASGHSRVTAAAPAYDLSCMYSSRREGMTQQKACAALNGEHLRVRPSVISQSVFEHGLTQIFCDGNWWYVQRDGTAQRMATMDNGADYFNAGLARAISHGKTGFVNRQLRFVIPARYDNAMPFYDGTADVCNGCVEVREDEHTVMQGGIWGKIDRTGREVVPVGAPDSVPLPASRH